jgi:hypothetical protein
MDDYPALKFVPEQLRAVRVQCANCGTPFSPDWLKQRGFPMGSIEAEGGYWVRLSAQEKCPSCGQFSEIALPVVDKKAKVALFGDEASRQLNRSSAYLYTYSLVGTSKPYLSGIESEIRQLKKEVSPDLDPDCWKIHMAIIWSGQQRRKRPEFANWNRQRVEALIDGIGEIIRGASDRVFKYNIVLAGQAGPPTGQQEFESYVRDEAYILLVMHVIDKVTSLGGQPVISFDSQKPSKANQVIHQWARDAFQSGQGNLLYSFLSHSIFVPEPVFVTPASHPLLEVADFMSFAVARHHYRIFNGAEPEIDLKILGDVEYLTFSVGGESLLFETSSGYPWKLDFPNLS